MTELPLANGVVIDTKTGQAIAPSLSADAAARQEKKDEAKSTGSRADRSNAAARGRDRSNKAVRTPIAELPADPRAITTVGVVWLYFSLGLSDFDISDATGLTLSQVDSIKGLSLFETIGDRVGHNLTLLGQEDIRSRIEGYATKSLDTLNAALDDDDVEAAVKVRVAQDLLDRAGHSAKQIIEHNHKLEGGLVIRHVRETHIDSDALPRVNIDRNGAQNA
jgi:hypothetical protein